MGGEKPFLFYGGSSDSGSPPRGRGKDHLGQRFHRRAGITPAWAGKSMTAPGRSSRTGDHPRVGGEKNNHIIDNQYGKGSPPRGRGKVVVVIVSGAPTRITPAWAGKSSAGHPSQRVRRDHPRVGGEKCCSTFWIFSAKGSPPRGRGKVLLNLLDIQRQRITPAWAGKRLSILGLSKGVKDHPRVGGEKHLSGTTDNRPQGSPPHGRGKGKRPGQRCNGKGITPAWAGKSPASQPWSPPLWMMVIRPRP